MNANPAIKVAASSSNLRGVFWRVFAAVFVTVMITGTAITFVMPEMYASTARVSIHDQPDVVGHNWPAVRGMDFEFKTNSPTYDPYFIQTTFEAMQSETVLSNVVAELNLNVKWGQRYYGGQTLTVKETIALLQKRFQAVPVRNTRMVAITVYSEDRNEAAEIANTLGAAYHDYGIEQQNRQKVKATDVLQAMYKDEEKQILTLQSNLVVLEQQYHIGQNPSEPGGTNSAAQPYWNERQKLNCLQRLHQALKQKIDAEKLDFLIPKHQMISVTDFAEPGKYPVRPNKPLCLALTLAMATVLGTLSGGVAVWLARRQENAMG